MRFIIGCILILGSLYARSYHVREVKLNVYNGITVFATRIIDGDTFEGRSNSNTYKIRLNGIDAPERGQDFYKVSKQKLGDLCLRGPLTVQLLYKDRYGRWIADVINNDRVSLNHAMVEAGLAWHFKKYSSDTSLARKELNARGKKIGLWQTGQAVEPWLYRKNKGLHPDR